MQSTIYQRVKKVREEVGLEQEDVAEAIKKPVTAISKIENGKQGIPTDLLTFYNSKYNISTDWILSGRGAMFIVKEEEKKDAQGITPQGQSSSSYAKGGSVKNENRIGVDNNASLIEFLKRELDERKAELKECQQKLEREQQKVYELMKGNNKL